MMPATHLRSISNEALRKVIPMFNVIYVLFQCVLITKGVEVPVNQDGRFDFKISNVKNGELEFYLRIFTSKQPRSTT